MICENCKKAIQPSYLPKEAMGGEDSYTHVEDDLHACFDEDFNIIGMATPAKENETSNESTL